MQIVIKKAAIRGSLFLSYEFEQIDANARNYIKTSSDAPIHEDLRTAFRKLIPHFSLICEEVKDIALAKKAIANHDAYLGDRETAKDGTFFKYRIYGFTLKENKGCETLELQGAKLLDNNEEINFCTYPIDMSDTEYDLLSDLNDAVEQVKAEVMLYMQGKYSPKLQLEMFGEEDQL